MWKNLSEHKIRPDALELVTQRNFNLLVYQFYCRKGYLKFRVFQMHDRLSKRLLFRLFIIYFDFCNLFSVALRHEEKTDRGRSDILIFSQNNYKNRHKLH